MRRAAVASLVFVLLVPGCSLGPREEWTKVIRGGFEIGQDEPTARVLQTVKVKVIETTIRVEPEPVIAESKGVADFDARTARMVEKGGRSATLIYEDLVAYASRSKGSIGTSKQRWARFDFEREPSVDIDDNDRRLAVGAGLISPTLAVELLEGVLTGSVEERGTGRRAGVSTTRYSARLSPDAAMIEIRDEDRREGVGRLLANLGIQQDDFPVDVWLDDQDRVRALRYVMRQQKDRVNAFTMTVYWEFSGFGTKAEIRPPGNDETVRSDRFRDFVEEVIREFG
jgi:hypothetical protein